MPDDQAYVFSPDKWANVVLMAEDGYDPEDNVKTLMAAFERHPLGCNCTHNEGCIRGRAANN